MNSTDAECHCFASGLLACDSRGKRGGLLRSLETSLARRSPGNGVSVAVGDCDSRVVEGRAHVSDALRLDDSLGLLSSSHYFVTFFLPAIARRGPFLVRAFVCVRWPRTGRPRRWRPPRYEPMSM